MVTDRRTVRALAAILTAPVDARLLGLFRALFGGVLLVAIVRFWAKGWIHDHFVAPTTHLPAIEGLGPLPPPGMTVVYALLAVAVVGITLGVATRRCAAAACALWTYQHLADLTHYLNHYYLVSLLLLLLVLVPSDRALSVRAWRDPSLPSTVPRWGLWALRVQVGLVYVFAGVAKLGSDWLLHAQPLRIWLGAHDALPLVGPVLAAPATAYVMSWLGAAFDLTIVLWLSIRRTRPWAYAVALVFHAVTGLLFPLGMFPWIMAVAALVFFPADAPARWLHRPARPARAERLGPAAALVGLHLIVQLVLPLRAWWAPGEVAWTERGFRWSWRVMLVEKAGSLDLEVHEPRTGRRWTISPREQQLTSMQARMASTQPDLVVALARRVAADFRRRGHDVEVRAHALVSWNGRPPALLFDPAADLARDDLDLDDVLSPAPEEPPP